MSKTMKSLQRLSMVVRNLGTLNNCTTIKRFIQTSAICSTKHSKESLVAPQNHLVMMDNCNVPQNPSVQQLLNDNGKEADIFRMIREKNNSMTGKDAVLTMLTLFNIHRSLFRKPGEMCKRKEFLTLCEILKRDARKLETKEIIVVLKSLIFFKVPTSSIIFQLFLQILRHSVNSLNLQQIAFVDFLLSKCESTPLVEALTIALPIVHEANVLLKLDRDNLQSIVMALKYLSRNSTNSNVFAVLIEALNKCPQPIDPLSANTILWSFCNMKCFPEGFADAINGVQNILAQNITSIDKLKIKNLLFILSEKVKFREKYFYHEGFVDATASLVVSDDWGLADASYVLEKLLIMDHVQISLLDYIAAKCYENPAILQECSPEFILKIAEAFSNADYKPAFWDVIQESMVSDRILDYKSAHFPFTKLAIYLLSLDCYHPKLLQKIFASNQNLLLIRKIERVKLLVLYQAVKTLYPQYSGTWPAEGIVNVCSIIFRQTAIQDFPLMSYLECALGGRRYVLTNVATKLGHRLDHVFIMRKGGFPIAINNRDESDSSEHTVVMLDEIQPPPDSQVILVTYMPSYAYSVNSQRMKGSWLLYIKSLEALSGYTVIPIHSTMWTGLSEFEKIPYLMQAIKLKCDEISVSANS